VNFPKSGFMLIILFDQLRFMLLLFYNFVWMERILYYCTVQLALKFLQYSRVLHWII